MKDIWNQFHERLNQFLEQRSTMRFFSTLRITYKVTWNMFLLMLMIGIIGMAFAGGMGAGYFASLVKDEPLRDYETMRTEIYNYDETSKLYFADNQYLGKLSSDLEREEVALSDVSEYVTQAVIATEDQMFDEHQGVVPKAIFRALFQEFTNSPQRTGGSTLTQQLIKNQLLTNEVSFDRKAKEILLALRLERFFEKDDIMEAYLNIVPFGRNASGRNIAGIQTAAQGVFGIDASELNLAQSAYLAGLPQSPFRFTPFANNGTVKSDISPGLDKMKVVLNRMLESGMIDKQSYEEALAYDIQADFAEPQRSPVQQYPWLTFEIEQRATNILANEMAKADGVSLNDVDDDTRHEYFENAHHKLKHEGYKVHSTIDKEIYDRMQTVKNQFDLYGPDKQVSFKDPDSGETVTVSEPVEVGALLMENKTGRIISFVGGRDFQLEQLNHATSALRSNGSTMKPLLVFAPALELGFTQPGSLIADVEYNIKAGNDMWSPHNYGGRYHGMTSARTALAHSYNIPAAKLYVDMLQAGHEPTKYLEQMGISSLVDADRSNYSMSLGALTEGVTVEENVNAFATFGNEGKFTDAYLIDHIENAEGKTIYKHESSTVQVFSEQTNYLMVDMLKDVVSRGTGRSLPGFLNFQSEWAGKTGTSQDYKDAWFVASNPQVTLGVWNGYDTPQSLPRYYRGYSYGVRNIKLWADLMNEAHAVNPSLIAGESFERPQGVVTQSICGISGKLPTELCQQAGMVTTDLINQKYSPTERDNSFVSGQYVFVDGTPYAAMDSTPSDFVQYGAMLNPDFVKSSGYDQIENPRQLLAGSINLVTPLPSTSIENGRAPTPVTLSGSGDTISWSGSDRDVVGYYVYQNGQLVSTLDSTTRQLPVSPATYTVVAVDIAGNTSQPSNEVVIGAPEPPAPEPEVESNEDKAADQDADEETINTNSNNEQDAALETNGDEAATSITETESQAIE
ncbi:penicillin-binding protein [Bacillaceae bacterium SIJ1]|uniref:transglycosylase domain-containing protein n=1 Tax=Litoribacterium kuwaitense TaxID=1398745 RepID=UPI0013ECC4B5|nr:transglycosylase domain-containing protein [Litoribacterium kuwaitense]NGP44195.1 penicillin-binding protein [Litoribacterium kuwaitense]